MNTRVKSLPEGHYVVLVRKAIMKSGKSGPDSYVLTLEVQGGAMDGRRVEHRLTLDASDPNVLGRFFKEMAAIGATRDFFRTNPTHDQVLKRITGSLAMVEVGDSTEAMRPLVSTAS